MFDNFYEVVKISEKSEDGKFANFTEEKIMFDIVFLTKALEIAEEYAAYCGIKPEKDANWYADDYTDKQRALFSKLSEHFNLKAIPIEEPSSDPTDVGVFTIREAVELLSLISSKPATLNQRLEITERNLHPRPDLLSGLEACILLGNESFYTDFDYIKDSLISPETFSENFSKIWDD